MKLVNFRQFDPYHQSKGSRGLSNASKLDEAIWNEFAHKPIDLALEAERIKAGIPDTSANALEAATDELDASYAAKEGKVSFRLHRTLERDRKIIQKRKELAFKQTGKLQCEACQFDFAETYGARGVGFIEVHHTNPVHAMKEGDETRLEDLALACANCHRMIHRSKPWLTSNEIRACLDTQASEHNTHKSTTTVSRVGK